MEYDINQLHMPLGVTDDQVDDILEIMNRIPVGWGRWISCDPGWYDLLIDLNRQLAEIDPDYELHQVKEKFGGLRYYISSNTAQWEEMQALIHEYERLSYTICETCGGDGENYTDHGWLLTRCVDCVAGTDIKKLVR